MPHIVGKLLTRAIIFLWTSLQLKVCTKSYGPFKLQKSQFQEFRDSQLGNCRTKWHLGASLWLIVENIIRGKPPSPGHGESCESMYVYNSSIHQKCSNYTLTNLLFGLCKSVWIVDTFVIHSSPHPEAPTCPSYSPPPPKMLQVKKHPSILFSIVFIFELAFKSLKEFGGALGGTKALKQVVCKWFLI